MSKQAVANKGGRGARQRILDTAAELFYRDGINATGVERLAAESSVSKRTLYQHFPSKTAVVEEYLRAVETYRFSYAELKRFARQSLEHSFLPGESLWSDTRTVFRIQPACKGEVAGSQKPSAACEQFLSASERGREQWKLESEFAKFEKKF